MFEKPSNKISGFVIDGSNIGSIGASPNDKDKKPQDRVELLPILLIVITLIKKKYDFFVYFDGNFKYGEKIQPHIGDFNTLLSHNKFNEAVSVQADNYIVQLAHAQRWGIISNDRYRDEKFTSSKYKWLQKQDSSRLVRASIAGNWLMLTGGLEYNIDTTQYTTDSAFKELFELLGISHTNTNEQPSDNNTPKQADWTTPPTDTTPPQNTSQQAQDDSLAWIKSDEELAQVSKPSFAQQIFAEMQKELRDRNNGTFKEQS